MSLPPLPLSDCRNVRSAFIQPAASELTVHALHAGRQGDPLVLIIHGFPEIAFSWRKVADALSEQGYFVVAPDTRGNGMTSGWDDRGHGAVDLGSFSASTLMGDALALVRELGYAEVHCVVGHDTGARTASLLALARPDIFRRVAVVAHPYSGPPAVAAGRRPLEPARPPPARPEPAEPVVAALAALPAPRKPYKWYYAGPDAADEMLLPLAGLKPFLRGYFYLKSANWPGNHPRPLSEWSAPELAKMPFYYTMPLHGGMRDAVRLELERSGCDPEPSQAWLPDGDLDVYAMAFAHAGFQGPLNCYRVATSAALQRDLQLYAGLRMKPPAMLILGEKDWGAYQVPHSLDSMPETCDRFVGTRWIAGAGHFPHLEQPAAVAAALMELCGVA